MPSRSVLGRSEPTPRGARGRTPLVTVAWIALSAPVVGFFCLSLSVAVYGGLTGRSAVGRYGTVGCLFAAVIARTIWSVYRTTET